MELFSRYGNEMSLIYATYKTTKYDLPLFLICVCTNINYSIVAEFIVQSEDTDSILEAVNILNEWNPKWAPNFFSATTQRQKLEHLNRHFLVLFTYATFTGNKLGTDGFVKVSAAFLIQSHYCQCYGLVHGLLPEGKEKIGLPLSAGSDKLMN